MWSGVWGRDESVFGDLSISLSHVLVDFKRLYSTGTRDRGQARVCAVENRSYSSKGRSYPTGRVCPSLFGSDAARAKLLGAFFWVGKTKIETLFA